MKNHTVLQLLRGRDGVFIAGRPFWPCLHTHEKTSANMQYQTPQLTMTFPNLLQLLTRGKAFFEENFQIRI